MNTQGMRGDGLLSAGAKFAPRPGFLARLLTPGFNTIADRVDAGLERGSLVAHLPGGTTRMLGGRAPGFEAEITVHDWRSLVRLATNGVIGFYQGFEAREWDSPDLVQLFAVMSANVRTLGNAARSSGPFKWAAMLAHRLNRNDRAGSARNISAHYDLGNDFYAAWLDNSMTYSSALGWADDGLEAAQTRKVEALADRLGRPERVLEIGCGWGTLADHIAGQGAQVTAISLSDEQLAYARSHTDPFIQYRKQDYRDVGMDVSGGEEPQFDAIASCEMVEALGREYWPEFMDCLERNLKPGGRAAIQYISLADPMFEDYASTADFIQAYIFPGGLLIKSSEFRGLAKARGMRWQDETSFGLDYAETLREWRVRFDRAVEDGRLPQGFDERFVRLWRFYLAYCEGGFRAGNINVHQVTLVKE